MLMRDPSAATPVSPPHTILSADETEKLIAHLDEVMKALLGLVEEETRLVRVGQLNDARTLEPAKADLASLYLTATERLKANIGHLSQSMPEAYARLRQRHDTFRAVLQMNLTVLATAHAVSEGIIRGVAAEVTRKRAPQIYGASGRPTAPGPGALQPVAVRRSL
jgi:hypothetical protein